MKKKAVLGLLVGLLFYLMYVLFAKDRMGVSLPAVLQPEVNSSPVVMKEPEPILVPPPAPVVEDSALLDSDTVHFFRALKQSNQTLELARLQDAINDLAHNQALRDMQLSKEKAMFDVAMAELAASRADIASTVHSAIDKVGPLVVELGQVAPKSGDLARDSANLEVGHTHEKEVADKLPEETTEHAREIEKKVQLLGLLSARRAVLSIDGEVQLMAVGYTVSGVKLVAIDALSEQVTIAEDQHTTVVNARPVRRLHVPVAPMELH